MLKKKNFFNLLKTGFHSNSPPTPPSPPPTAAPSTFNRRALPPVPQIRNNNNNGPADEGTAYFPEEDEEDEETSKLKDDDANGDFAASVDKYGWYWGPISSDIAERLLEKEPEGSFVVRDSSDDHYIFSLTVKLDNVVRHVRIEHNHGIFSFGNSTRFKSRTIGDFIENAVEHSRSGRFLFFVHRRPELGPMRVQLLHPVSRFKQVESLKHLSRFVILKQLSRDLLDRLPVPKQIQDYLNTPFYYSEEIDSTSR